MRVLTLVPYPLGAVPSQRFRLEQWAPLIASQATMDLVPFADERLWRTLYRPASWLAKAARMSGAFIRRLELLPSLGSYDVVVVHRAAAIAGPALIERLMAAKRPMVYDFDDAVYVTHTAATNERLGWLKFAGKTAVLCRLASQVSVGTAYLADYVLRYNQAVTVVPSSVDTERYRPVPPRTGGPVVVGWMGSSTSQTHLEQFASMLSEVTRRCAVDIRIVSDRPPVLPGVPISWHPWSAATELEELQRLDIGIMPMPDDAFARGKGAMKALLYMSMGIPVVCSPVGAARDVVRDHETGLLASSDEQWVDALSALAGDASWRRRLGAAGRAAVEDGYSARGSAARFAALLERAVS